MLLSGKLIAEMGRRYGIRGDLAALGRNLASLQVLLTKILKTCDGLRRFY